MTYAFLIVAAAISIYALLCVVRIILTWIPGGSYTGFGRFLSALCDPYLNLFRRGWLRLGTIDFSPLVALAVLTLASILFQTLGDGTRVTLAAILILVIEIVWKVVASILLFLIVVLVIRLIVFLSRADRNSPLWAQIDASLNPLVYTITKFFTGNRLVAYKNALIFAIILLLVLRIGGVFAVGALLRICALIPF